MSISKGGGRGREDRGGEGGGKGKGEGNWERVQLDYIESSISTTYGAGPLSYMYLWNVRSDFSEAPQYEGLKCLQTGFLQLIISIRVHEVHNEGNNCCQVPTHTLAGLATAERGEGGKGEAEGGIRGRGERRTEERGGRNKREEKEGKGEGRKKGREKGGGREGRKEEGGKGGGGEREGRGREGRREGREEGGINSMEGGINSMEVVVEVLRQNPVHMWLTKITIVA